MVKEKKMYLTAREVAEILGISVGHAYKLVKKMNEELESQGYMVVSGKVPTRYFEKRWYGFEK